jgi:hypothetical protein
VDLDPVEAAAEGAGLFDAEGREVGLGMAAEAALTIRDGLSVAGNEDPCGHQRKE